MQDPRLFVLYRHYSCGLLADTMYAAKGENEFETSSSKVHCSQGDTLDQQYGMSLQPLL